MKISKFSVIFALVLAIVGNCTSAKLPKNGTKDPKTSQLRHNKPAHSVQNKNTDQIDQPSPATKHSSKANAKKVWSAKSVIVRPQSNAVMRSRFSSNPLLDRLYERRYHALEEVAKINSRINSILQNSRRNNYNHAVSSFLNPGSFNSGLYGVHGGSMVLGPASAGSVAGVENPQIRQLAVKMSKHYVNSQYNAPIDMPQPMDDTNSGSTKPLQNATDKLADVDDPAELGDPMKFDSVCSVLKLTFEHTQGAMILDDSPKTNNAQLEDGAYVTNTDSKSGISAIIGDDGYLQIPTKFKGKPQKAAAISMWVKLRHVDGVNPLFQAADRNDTIHYDLSVVDGKVMWTHRSDIDKEIFKVKAGNDSRFTAGAWHHIVGAYSSKKKEATLWLDGKEIGHQKDVVGKLSQDWTKVLMFEGKTAGFADNIFMFRCPLDRTKIIALYVAAASPKDAKKSAIPKP